MSISFMLLFPDRSTLLLKYWKLSKHFETIMCYRVIIVTSFWISHLTAFWFHILLQEYYDRKYLLIYKKNYLFKFIFSIFATLYCICRDTLNCFLWNLHYTLSTNLIVQHQNICKIHNLFLLVFVKLHVTLFKIQI